MKAIFAIIKDKSILIVIIVIMIFCFGLSGLEVYDLSERFFDTNTMTTIRLNWTLTDIRGRIVPFEFGQEFVEKAGKPIRISALLPEQYFDGAAVFFYSEQQSVFVYVGGRRIYTWNNKDERAFGNSSPNKWHVIPLEEDNMGKQLTVVFLSPYERTSNRINVVQLGKRWEIDKYILYQYLPSYIICIVLMCYGGVISLIFSLKRFSAKRAQRFGLFVLFVAVYVRSKLNMPPILALNEYLSMQMRYVVFLTLPIVYVQYAEIGVSERRKTIFDGFLIISYINMICSILLVWQRQMPCVNMSKKAGALWLWAILLSMLDMQR